MFYLHPLSKYMWWFRYTKPISINTNLKSPPIKPRKAPIELQGSQIIERTSLKMLLTTQANHTCCQATIEVSIYSERRIFLGSFYSPVRTVNYKKKANSVMEIHAIKHWNRILFVWQISCVFVCVHFKNGKTFTASRLSTG